MVISKLVSVSGYYSWENIVYLQMSDERYSSSDIYVSHSSLYGDEPLYQIYHQGAVVRDVLTHDAGGDEVGKSLFILIVH